MHTFNDDPPLSMLAEQTAEQMSRSIRQLVIQLVAEQVSRIEARTAETRGDGEAALRETDQNAGLSRETYTVEQMAQKLGVGAQLVRQQLASGVIPGRKVGGIWLAKATIFDEWMDDYFGRR